MGLGNGARDLDLRYVSHHIAAGANQRCPACLRRTADDAAEADTLTIVLRDTLSGLEVQQRYSAFREARDRALGDVVKNPGTRAWVLGVASASVDLILAPQHLLSLDGAWGRERERHRSAVRPGVTLIQSRRGESSHRHNPFLALCDANADEPPERCARSRSFTRATTKWRSNTTLFRACACRPDLPETFRWPLEPGERFDTPECVLVYSSAGLGGMSRTFHGLYRSRLVRGPWRDRRGPCCSTIGKAPTSTSTPSACSAWRAPRSRSASSCSCSMTAGSAPRSSDRAGLGDWLVNEQKLPGGLARLANEMNALGMMFGLWFEPEMVNPDSDLYRAHPDWCLHVPGRSRQLLRTQLVLDITRPEIRDHVMTQVLTVMRSANIGYVKWDMNRLLDAYCSLGVARRSSR